MRTQIEEQLNYIGNQLRTIAGKGDKGLESYQRIAMLSALGKLNEYVSTGDSFDVEWYDGSIYTSENKTAFPMVIGDLNHEVEYEDGSKGKATGLEAQYACPSSIQFDEKEAIIGGIALTKDTTYNFLIAKDDWGNKNGVYYNFTPTIDIPASAMGVCSGSYNDASWTGKEIKFYANGLSDTVLATCVLAEGQAGTDLGSTDGTGSLNHYHRATLGSNRWITSALRQWMNSDKPAGQWWTQQHKWDRHPAQSSSLNGFLFGMDKEFLAQIKKVKIVTGNADSPDGGTLDVSYDRFFPLALNEKYINPMHSGEGESWKYYKDLNAKNGRNSKYALWNTYPELAKAKINDKNSTQYVWLRSCYRGDGNYVFSVGPSGGVSTAGAYGSHFVAPACYI